MGIIEVMRERHSVRSYLNQTIKNDDRLKIEQIIQEVCANQMIQVQPVYDEPEAFTSILSKYGHFTNANNYLVVSAFDEELCGYLGEKIVLKLQAMGISTCWVVASFKKNYVKTLVKSDYPLKCVIAFGYGATNGQPHTNKGDEVLMKIIGDKPEWFDLVFEAVKLAPTAINQQEFMLVVDHGRPSVIKRGIGLCQTMDIGIVKCHLDLICQELGLEK